MRFVTPGLIAAGLGTWLAAGVDRTAGDAPDRGPQVVPAEPGLLAEPWLLAEAEDRGDEAVSPGRQPPRSSHHQRGEMGERRGWDRSRGSSGRAGFGRRFGRPDGRPMSPEHVDELMEFTREHFPKLHERLSELRTSHHPGFQKMIRRVDGHIGAIMDLWKREPELARLMVRLIQTEMELTDLQKQHRGAASPEQREQIERSMREQLDTLFDLRLERLRFEIKELERRLEETKQHLAERESNKEGIIDEELQKLVAGQALDRVGPLGPHGPLMRKPDALPPPPPPPPDLSPPEQ